MSNYPRTEAKHQQIKSSDILKTAKGHSRLPYIWMWIHAEDLERDLQGLIKEAEHAVTALIWSNTPSFVAIGKKLEAVILELKAKNEK
jgi:hypothetical protein